MWNIRNENNPKATHFCHKETFFIFDWIIVPWLNKAVKKVLILRMIYKRHEKININAMTITCITSTFVETYQIGIRIDELFVN